LIDIVVGAIHELPLRCARDGEADAPAGLQMDDVDVTSDWRGICGECGVRVEGERPESVEVA
jgi:hypothetical protein